MKKILLAMFICITSLTAFAQNPPNGGVSNVNDTTCFCCGDFYNLPKPVISGPESVNCGDKPTYCIPKCPKATINWSVSPTNAFTTNSTGECITLTAPLTPGVYTIAVTLSCANRKVTSSIRVKVNGAQNCTPLFTVTFTPQSNGTTLNINTLPLTTTGVEHYWGIQYNGTYPTCNPCTSIPFADFSSNAAAYSAGIFGGYVDASGTFTGLGQGTGKTSTSSGINYTGFPINSCFRITHYIKCCGVWYKQTVCYTGTSSAKMVNGGTFTPNTTKTEVERVELRELPKELRTAD